MQKETLVRTIYMKIPPRLLYRINLVHIFVTSGFAAESNHLRLDSERTGSAWQCQSLVQTLAPKDKVLHDPVSPSWHAMPLHSILLALSLPASTDPASLPFLKYFKPVLTAETFSAIPLISVCLP